LEPHWRPTIINLNIINYTTSGECEKTGKTDKTLYKDCLCNTVLSILSIFPVLSLSTYKEHVRILMLGEIVKRTRILSSTSAKQRRRSSKRRWSLIMEYPILRGEMGLEYNRKIHNMHFYGIKYTN